MSSVHSLTVGQQTVRLLMRSHAALHFDFCPWANRWVYWLKNPFWVLLTAAIAAGSCGVFVNPYLLAVGGCLVLVLLLGVVWPWIAIRGIQCSVRFLETRGRESQPTMVRVEIVNRWIVPAWGLHLAGGFGWETQGDQHGMALAAVPGWGKTVISWRFTPSQRGVYPLGAAFIETGFPFGFLHARRRVDVQGELIVWPKSVLLDDLPDAFEIDYCESRTSPHRTGTAGDVMGSRLFRQGDSLRQVHWSQSARQGRLVVREREAPTACSVRLVVDLRTGIHSGAGPEASLERSLRVAASLVESLHNQHAQVECVLGQRVIRVGESLADVRRCLDHLARSERVSESPFAPALAKSSVTQFVITTERGLTSVPKGVKAARILVSAANGSSSTGSPVETESVLSRLPQQWRRACHVG